MAKYNKKALRKKITKAEILSRVSEEEIFEFYLGARVDLHTRYKSLLREDDHPTCTFSYRGGRLRLRDWSETGDRDCFDLVMRMYNLPFPKALDKVSFDLGITNKPIDAELVARLRTIKEYSQKSGGRKKISVRRQPLTEKDIAYLGSFGITQETAEYFDCSGVRKIWIDDVDRYYYKEYDPALAYYFGKEADGRHLWKVYYYKRKDMRFVSNTIEINGWKQLPSYGQTCIITKSMKDVMVLFEMGIASIAPQAETMILPRPVIAELRNRFTYLYSFFDYDRAGEDAADRLRPYGIQPIFLTNGENGTTDWGSKDISDYVRDQGFDKAVEFVKQVLS